MQGDGLKLLEDRLTEKKQGKPGFDPTVIIQIITAILGVLGICPKPTPAALRRRFLNRARIASNLRQETGMSWQDAMTQANELFDLADTATDDELNLLIADAK